MDNETSLKKKPFSFSITSILSPERSEAAGCRRGAKGSVKKKRRRGDQGTKSREEEEEIDVTDEGHSGDDQSEAGVENHDEGDLREDSSEAEEEAEEGEEEEASDFLTASEPYNREEDSRSVIKVPAQRPPTSVSSSQLFPGSGAMAAAAAAAAAAQQHVDFSPWMYRPLPLAAAAAGGGGYHLPIPPNVLASKFAG